LELQTYKTDFSNHLEVRLQKKEPAGLYNPIHYILNLGAKRIRPVLTLMSCDLFGGEVEKALDAALAVEVFHNFSLIHDDIMDDAPLRRGKATVHEKWNLNAGILSGDAMLILANQLLESYQGSQFKKLVSVFNKTALEVCEGQQYDVDFEKQDNVSEEQYIHMITLKTAVLLATALQFGAIIASAHEDDMHNIYNFGLNLGIAFQLQDDYLDAFGNPETFGKQIGGDIIENKKTLLYIKALELASVTDKKALVSLYSEKQESEGKVEKVKILFLRYGIPNLIEEEISKYTFLAISNIDKLSLNMHKKEKLKSFSKSLMERKV